MEFDDVKVTHVFSSVQYSFQVAEEQNLRQVPMISFGSDEFICSCYLG